jgi:hypothetical protein
MYTWPTPLSRHAMKSNTYVLLIAIKSTGQVFLLAPRLTFLTTTPYINVVSSQQSAVSSRIVSRGSHQAKGAWPCVSEEVVFILSRLSELVFSMMQSRVSRLLTARS